MKKNSNQQNKVKKISIKRFLTNMDRIHKKTEKLFKEDENLLKLLRNEVNAQRRRRRAS